MKGAKRSYCNEGQNVLTAGDTHTVLKERPVQGCTASVCHVNETKKGMDIKKLQQFSAMHDFSYQQDGLRVWKAFQVGPGKLIPWDEIHIKHKGATDLITEQENFGFTPRVTHNLFSSRYIFMPFLATILLEESICCVSVVHKKTVYM